MAKFFLQEMVKVKQQTEAQPIEISPRKDRGQIKTEKPAADAEDSSAPATGLISHYS